MRHPSWHVLSKGRDIILSTVRLPILLSSLVAGAAFVASFIRMWIFVSGAVIAVLAGTLIVWYSNRSRLAQQRAQRRMDIENDYSGTDISDFSQALATAKSGDAQFK